MDTNKYFKEKCLPMLNDVKSVGDFMCLLRVIYTMCQEDSSAEAIDLRHKIMKIMFDINTDNDKMILDTIANTVNEVLYSIYNKSGDDFTVCKLSIVNGKNGNVYSVEEEGHYLSSNGKDTQEHDIPLPLVIAHA